MPDQTDDLHSQLAKSLDQAPWLWIKPHAERDAVIVVDPALNLLDVGEKVARDQSTEVGKLIAKGQLKKPTHEQLEAWNLDASRLFKMLVVQPYVLIQSLDQ